MIEFKITDSTIESAKSLYGFYNIKNSITKGMSQDFGALGEAVFMEYYGFSPDQYSPTKDYDFLTDKGVRIDIKTKKTTVKPQEHHFCSVAKTSYHQVCDYYCFIRISADMSLAWICGFISKENMFKHGKYFSKGDLDPSSKNGFTFKEDCVNIEIGKLNLTKSTKFNKIFIRGLGFEVSENNGFISTNFIKVEKNGFDSEIKLSFDENVGKLTIETPKSPIFEGYVGSQSDWTIITNLLRIKLK